MNTFLKFAPNVYVAKCTEQHSKGDSIILTTKYGKEVECIVFNIVGRTKDECFCYSIQRVDEMPKRSEKLEKWAESAKNKSDKYYEKSQEHAGFLSLGEPIKVGHHSEKRHRKIIENSWNNMGKSVEYKDEQENYLRRAEYWKEKEAEINLSKIESIEFYEYKLEEAKMKHEGLLNGSISRDHSFSLTYAKKAVKEFEAKLKTAKLLWA